MKKKEKTNINNTKMTFVTIQEDIKNDRSCSCTAIIQAIDGHSWNLEHINYD